ncbi:MAG: sulfur carrier protein ThiS adenylyltransferase ThiF [Bacteroidales bacterium]|jgi:sulfur carrier protein ThiS adenylyltransferase|nr:sulfur carrier protein ThiS adenylyltransferase ThiF [Bacteroidales bacterium]
MEFQEIKRKLKTKTVGIVGCGGLGSNCAVALARVGVGRLIIADFDKIEESNLNRQYFFWDQIGKIKSDTLKENIERINPELEVISHHVFIDESNFKNLFNECDLIIEAFDSPESKEMILRAMSKFFPDKTLIMGIGISGWGQNDSLKETRYPNLIICGDQKSEVSDELPPLAPRVGIVANMQANVALEILLK